MDAERAARIDPDWAKARARVAESCTLLGRHADAVRAYRLALKLEPGNASYAAALRAAEASAKSEEMKTAVKEHERQVRANAAEPRAEVTEAQHQVKRAQTLPSQQPRPTPQPQLQNDTDARGKHGSSVATGVHDLDAPSPPSSATRTVCSAASQLESAVRSALLAAEAAKQSADQAEVRRDDLLREITELEKQRDVLAGTVAMLQGKATVLRHAMTEHENEFISRSLNLGKEELHSQRGGQRMSDDERTRAHVLQSENGLESAKVYAVDETREDEMPEAKEDMTEVAGHGKSRFSCTFLIPSSSEDDEGEDDDGDDERRAGIDKEPLNSRSGGTTLERLGSEFAVPTSDSDTDDDNGTEGEELEDEKEVKKDDTCDGSNHVGDDHVTVDDQLEPDNVVESSNVTTAGPDASEPGRVVPPPVGASRANGLRVEATESDEERRASEMLAFFEAFEAEFGADISDEDSGDESWAERWEQEQWDNKQKAKGVVTASGLDEDSEHRQDTSSERRLRKTSLSPDGPSDGALGKVGGLISVDALAKLVGASTADQLGDADHEGHVRGPCRCCRGGPKGSCFAFVSRSGWKSASLPLPLAVINPPRSASADALGSAQRVYDAALARLEAAADGAICARCGCAASKHMTRREFMRHSREAHAREAAAHGEAEARARRVEAAKRRTRRALVEHETLHETNADVMSGAERLGCDRCGPTRCRRFACVYTDADTGDPEVMLFCSTCGCEAEKHAECPEWRREQDAAERRRRADEENRRRDARERMEKETRGGVDDAGIRTKHLATLGLIASPTDRVPSADALSRADITRAYRRAALRYHPDKHGAGGKKMTDKFVAVTEAFKWLTTNT